MMSPNNYLHHKKDLLNLFTDHTFVGYKRSIISPENARTNNPTAIFEAHVNRF